MSNLPSWARVGAKVVCVDGKRTHVNPAFANSELVERSIYTIREVSEDGGLWVEEITARPVLINGVVCRYVDHPFRISRFRPLVTLKDDIAAHFEHHLRNDHRAPEKADA